MSKIITIKEYEFLQSKIDNKFYVDEKELKNLENFILKNEKIALFLKPSFKKGYGKVLIAQNYVGIIQTKDGTSIEILPKIKNATIKESKQILLKMLKTLKNSPFRNFNMANLKNTKLPLFEIFISMFLDELSILIKKGIKSSYITIEQNQSYLKGKLKIKEQIKYNHIHKERFFVEYDEFLSDRIENQLIKTTLNYLYKKSTSTKNQQKIREYLFIFDDINFSKNPKEDFKKVKLDRSIKDYQNILLWCKTFLLQNSFSPYKGKDVAFALLFDMNLLFESYVYEYLKRTNKFENITTQDKKHYLAYQKDNGKFRLIPDIVINSGKIILDTKWKLLSNDKTYFGISQNDMYQLYAYGTKYETCKKLYLVYPKDEIESIEGYDFFKDKRLNLEVVFFDLIDLEKNSFHFT